MIENTSPPDTEKPAASARWACSPEKEINEQVGRRLYHLRMKRRLNVKLLSAALDVSHQQYRKYENGQTTLTAEKIFLAARLLKVSPDWFFEGCRDFVPPAETMLDHWPDKPGGGEIRMLTDAYRAITDKRTRAQIFMQIWRMADANGRPTPEG